MFPISIGAEIYFAEGADTLAANLLEARPTIMTAVPRLYETMHQRIRLGIERERGLKRRLFEQAVAIGRKRLAGERAGARRAAARPGARPARARQGAGAVRRPAQGDGLGRRAAQPRDRQLLPGARRHVCCRATARPRRRRSIALQPARRASGSTPSARRSTASRSRIAEDGEILVARRQCHEGLLERPRGDRAHPRRRLAAYRRYRPSRRRRLSAHHRPQARLHQELGRRHDLAGAGRGRADPGAGDRPGDGVRRPPALSRRGHRARPRFRRRLRPAAWGRPASSPRWPRDPGFHKALGDVVARVNRDLAAGRARAPLRDRHRAVQPSPTRR